MFMLCVRAVCVCMHVHVCVCLSLCSCVGPVSVLKEEVIELTGSAQGVGSEYPE